MSVKSYIFISWCLFFLLALSSYFQVRWAVSIHYHPHAPNTSYYKAYSKAHYIALATSFFLALFISIFRESISANVAKNVLAAVYGIAIVLSIATIASVSSHPKYFIQHIGHTPYKICSDFTQLGSNKPSDKARVRIDICLLNMKGIYDRNSKYCRYITTVTISKKKFSDFFSPSYYFKNCDGFSLSGARLSYTNNMDRFRVEGYKNLYAIEPDKVYFQLDDSGNLLRFSQRINNKAWEHISRRNIGTIDYYEYEMKQFDLEVLRSQEKQIENLISSWQQSPSR